MLEKIKLAIWWIWGLPQNLIGFFMLLYFHHYLKFPVTKHNDAWVLHYEIKNIGAVSLGQYIFLWSNYGRSKEKTIKHEYGHTRQSHLLGPLYLIVIGLPSIIWNMFFGKYRRRTGKSYYDFFPERWADKLGGVER